MQDVTRWGIMEVEIPDRKMKRAFEDDRERTKRFGVDMATKIRARLGALLAAESLADFWPPASGPERCHELKGDLDGIFSMDLKQPYRLLFRPVGEERKKDADEKQRWSSIKVIEITGIEDTHG